MKKLPTLSSLVIHYQLDFMDYQKSTNPTTPSDLLSLFVAAPHITLPTFTMMLFQIILFISLDAVPLFTNDQIGIAIKGIRHMASNSTVYKNAMIPI